MAKQKKILAFGTFDLLHPGHMAFLAAAAAMGELTVVVTPDAKVKAEKGSEPFFSQEERLAMVGAIKGVSEAILGDKDARWTVVSRLAPDVICVGYDQNATHPKFLAQVAGLRKPPEIVRIEAHVPERFSSSKVRLEIHKSGRK